MRPPTPNLTTYFSSFIRDPSDSPTRLESPIDTIAQSLSIPDHDSTASTDPESTPTMNYSSLTSTCSPFLQQQREQELDALQHQQCISGLAQIYAPLPSVAAPSLPSASAFMVPSSSFAPPLPRSSTTAFDDADPDSDYVPGGVAISSSRKRSNSPHPSLQSEITSTHASAHSDVDSSAPPSKRQRAAPSGPISTKDWIPPDVTGLNKREARLVKNRAAAFLSRQRKREEFEAMEGRVQELEAENARLRQNAQQPPPSFALFSTIQPSSAELSQGQQQYQQVLAQLDQSRQREEALAAQLRDAQASLARLQQRSPQSHQPLILHEPLVSEPALMKTEAMDEDRGLLHPASRRMFSQDSSDDDSDDDDQTHGRGRSRKEKGQLVLREKGSGNVAVMVLLFSLSLLSGGQHRGNTGATENPSQFSFELPSSGSDSPTFDLRMQQPQPPRQESLQRRIKENEYDSQRAATHWTALDSLDDEFNYFDRQHHLGSSDSFFDVSNGALEFGLGGLGLGLGLSADDGLVNPKYSLGMSMGDAMAYPTLSTFGSPFSVASSSLPSVSSTSSISTPSSRPRAMSPSATSSSGVPVATSAFNRQVEVSVSTSVSSLSKQEGGVSFDLKLADADTNGSEDDDGVSNRIGGASSAGSGKTVTVHVRKVPSSTSSLPQPAGKNTILLELTTSASSGSSGSPDELEALNADFEALLGGGLAVPSELGGMQSHAQWRLALAPRDAM